MKKMFLFLLVVSALYFLFHSEIFNINSFSIKGNDLLSRKEIIEISGAKKGTNIFNVNLEEMEEKIELHPVIKDAEVKRVFPNSLSIEVQEHKPSAVIATQGGFMLLDKRGYLIEQVERISHIELPVITGVDVKKNVAPGDTLSNKKLYPALRILTSTEPDDLRFVAEIDVKNPACINLYTHSGIKIVLGDGERIGKKIETAKKILSQVDKQVEYIDLRYPKSPVVKYFE